MALDYDNSAFYYFAIFALLVYIVPSTWYIIKSVRKYQREVAQKVRGSPLLSCKYRRLMSVFPLLNEFRGGRKKNLRLWRRG